MGKTYSLHITNYINKYVKYVGLVGARVNNDRQQCC